MYIGQFFNFCNGLNLEHGMDNRDNDKNLFVVVFLFFDFLCDRDKDAAQRWLLVVPKNILNQTINCDR